MLKAATLGLVFMLVLVSASEAAGSRRKRQSFQDMMNMAGQAMHNLPDSAQDALNHAQDLANQAVHNLPGSVQDAMNHAQDTLDQGFGDLGTQLSNMIGGGRNLTALMNDPDFAKKVQALDPTDPDYIQNLQNLVNQQLSGSAAGLAAPVLLLALASVLARVVFYI